MLTTILTVVLVAYIFILTISLLVLRSLTQGQAEGKPLFYLFGILSALGPFIFVWSWLRLFFGGVKPVPFSENLARVEDEIENERIAIFGGKPMHPSVSERWKLGYVKALAKTAKQVDPRIAPLLEPSSPVVARTTR